MGEELIHRHHRQSEHLQHGRLDEHLVLIAPEDPDELVEHLRNVWGRNIGRLGKEFLDLTRRGLIAQEGDDGECVKDGHVNARLSLGLVTVDAVHHS